MSNGHPLKNIKEKPLEAEGKNQGVKGHGALVPKVLP